MDCEEDDGSCEGGSEGTDDSTCDVDSDWLGHELSGGVSGLGEEGSVEGKGENCPRGSKRSSSSSKRGASSSLDAA